MKKFDTTPIEIALAWLILIIALILFIRFYQAEQDVFPVCPPVHRSK